MDSVVMAPIWPRFGHDLLMIAPRGKWRRRPLNPLVISANS